MIDNLILSNWIIFIFTLVYAVICSEKGKKYKDYCFALKTVHVILAFSIYLIPILFIIKVWL